MGWWNDVKRSEADQGIEDLSIKEVAKGSLDDHMKEEVCIYLIIFNR